MSEEIKSAETNIDAMNDENADIVKDEVSEIADTDQNNQQEVNDFEFTDTKVDEDASKQPPVAKKTQTSEQNAEFARRRREQEQKDKLAKVEEETRIKTLIEMTDGINPYTQEPMVDSIDVQKYLAMRKIEKDGGDPIADYHKIQSKQQKEEIEKQKKKDEEAEWYKNDRLDFEAKHPEMKDHIGDLLRDEQFLQYGEGKFGNMPLAEIFNGYTKMISTFQNKAKSIAEKMYANRQSSPGPLNSSETTKTKSWDEMSVKEFEAEIQAAKNGKYKKP